MNDFGTSDTTSTGLIVLKNEIKELLYGSLHHMEKLKRMVVASNSQNSNVKTVHFTLCEALVESIPLIADNPKHFINFIKCFEESQWLKPGNLELSIMFANFLIDLVRSNGSFLAQTIKLLVHNFWYANITEIPVKALGSNNGRINEHEHPDVGIVLHVTICTLFQSVPLGKQVLLPLAMKRFPHQSIDIDFQVKYFSHILHISTYYKEYTKSILNLIVERMIKLDVEIKVEDAFSDIEEEDEDDYDTMTDQTADNNNNNVAKKDEDTMFMMEDDDEEDERNGIGSTPELNNNSNNKKIKNKAMMVDKTAEILDVTMNIFFKYLKRDLNDQQRRDTILHVLHDIFNKTILRTHRSKYVQFILFWVGSEYPTFAKSMIHNLLQKLEEKSIHMYERRTCAAYIASLVSRAKYLDFGVVMYVLSKFTTLAKVYINTLKTSNKAIFKLSDINGPKNISVMADLAKSTSDNNNNGVMNLKKHEMFYCLCQSAFYILAFRGQEALDDERYLKTVSGFVWKDLFEDDLVQPLKYCLTSVSAEFLKVAKKLKLMTDHWINEREKQLADIENIKASRNTINNNVGNINEKKLYKNKRLLYETGANSDQVSPMTPMRKKQRVNKSSSFDHESETEEYSSSLNSNHTTKSTNSNIGVEWRQCCECSKWRSIPKNIWENVYKNNPEKIATFKCFYISWDDRFNRCSKPEENRTETTNDDNNKLDDDKNDGYNGNEYDENPLDSFFPFDPCCLRRTLKYIGPNYRAWSDIDNKVVANGNNQDNENGSGNAIPIPHPQRERLKSYDPFSWDSSFSGAGVGSNVSDDNDHDNGFHDVVYSGVSMTPNSDDIRKNRLEKMYENGGVGMRKRAISQASSNGSW